MKKIFIMFLFFISLNNICAKEIKVEFYDCVDGDTAKFLYKEEKITARFLAIDTPETVHPTKEEEAYGKEASKYTCNILKNAKEIILEFDEDSDEKDKYDRYLVWIFVDKQLLQEELVKKGLANVAYLYGDYKYTDKLEKAEQLAEENKLGIWNINANEDEISKKEENDKEDKKNSKEKSDKSLGATDFINEYKEYIILIGCLFIVSLFNLKSKKKIKTKLKNKIKKDIKKRLK